MSDRILVQFHYLGPIILMSPDDFLKERGEFYDIQRQNLASCLGIKSSDLTKEIVERYIEVTPKEAYQAITPAHDKIRARIVEPLRVAKKAYCFEEYLTSIALSGIVGETMAHVLYQINDTRMNGMAIDPDFEKAIFGKSFDKLGQVRRIGILNKLGYISNIQREMLLYLQKTRVPYMHWWNLGKSASDIKKDAQRAVVEATELFSGVFDVKLASALSVSVSDKVQAFLDKVGESIGPFYNSRY